MAAQIAAGKSIIAETDSVEAFKGIKGRDPKLDKDLEDMNGAVMFFLEDAFYFVEPVEILSLERGRVAGDRLIAQLMASSS
jgi:hypothetical protein